ncbi:MAG: hypothetical protein ACI4J0_02435 [Huintestinicola sp.]|uniref:hypothetical protein n=1 Tax=Huintestinicola sp. TaxID=2981661 RepID=UPI003EFD0C49
MTKAYYELLLKLISFLPEAEPLNIPDGIEDGFTSMFGLFGFFFPYDLYAPLIIFILGFTCFRIAWSIFVTFKK